MKKITLLLALLGTVGFSTLASAEAGPYVGVDLGFAKSGLSDSDIQGATNIDSTNFAYKLFGGYKIDDNWAVEGAFADLGKTSYDDAGQSGDVSLRAFSVSGVGTYAVNKDFDVFAKLGLATVKARDSIGGVSASQSHGSWLAGAGAAYHFDKNYDVKVEWNRYVNAVSTGADADSFTVGFAYKF